MRSIIVSYTTLELFQSVLRSNDNFVVFPKSIHVGGKVINIDKRDRKTILDKVNLACHIHLMLTSDNFNCYTINSQAIIDTNQPMINVDIHGTVDEYTVPFRIIDLYLNGQNYFDPIFVDSNSAVLTMNANNHYHFIHKVVPYDPYINQLFIIDSNQMSIDIYKKFNKQIPWINIIGKDKLACFKYIHYFHKEDSALLCHDSPQYFIHNYKDELIQKRWLTTGFIQLYDLSVDRGFKWNEFLSQYVAMNDFNVIPFLKFVEAVNAKNINRVH